MPSRGATDTEARDYRTDRQNYRADEERESEALCQCEFRRDTGFHQPRTAMNGDRAQDAYWVSRPDSTTPRVAAKPPSPCPARLAISMAAF